jgi:hypothetical protein
MRSRRTTLPSQTAALAGIPAGIQAIGPWAGRRQLFVRFAVEAETATMFTADALKGELTRLTARSSYHSITIGGRDPLAQGDFLTAALTAGAPLPVLLDHDGQRPEALEPLLSALALVQVVVDGTESAGAMERTCASLGLAVAKRVAHALIIVPADGGGASDAQLLRMVEQVHAASDDTAIVVHPTAESASAPDRRWAVWLERATGMHQDVRLLARLPSPTGMR